MTEEEIDKDIAQDFIEKDVSELASGAFSRVGSGKTLYENKQRVKLTGVKVARRPKGLFVKTDKTTLSEVVVEIRNFGDHDARGVKAELFVPGYDESFDLSGPSELKPYEQAKFKAEPNLVIFVEGRLKAKVICDNCYPN